MPSTCLSALAYATSRVSAVTRDEPVLVASLAGVDVVLASGSRAAGGPGTP